MIMDLHVSILFPKSRCSCSLCGSEELTNMWHIGIPFFWKRYVFAIAPRTNSVDTTEAGNVSLPQCFGGVSEPGPRGDLGSMYLLP